MMVPLVIVELPYESVARGLPMPLADRGEKICTRLYLYKSEESIEPQPMYLPILKYSTLLVQD